MWTQFILENLHFAGNIFVGLVFFAVFWLYLDAWQTSRKTREIPRIIGFFLLCVSFIIHSTYIESNLLAANQLSHGIQGFWFTLARLGGYLLILIGSVSEPLQDKPKYENGMITFASLKAVTPFAYPLLPFLIAGFYFRRGIIGLEKHIEPVAWAFVFLTMAEILSLVPTLLNTSNVILYKLGAPFGPIWIAEHLFYLVAAVILAKWVFGYLLKRLQSQLFMIFIGSILGIFVITTAAFTGILFHNLQVEGLQKLNTDAQVLNLALESKKSEILSDTVMISQNPLIQAGILANSHANLSDIAENILLTKNENFLDIASAGGQVLTRGENRDRIGDSLSSDPLVKRALQGQANSSIVAVNGVLAPDISIRAAAPIIVDNKIIGVIMSGTTVDNSFVDGLEKATGLVISIYGSDKLSATSLKLGADISRPIGIKENNRQIIDQVLKKGQNYQGTVSLLSVPYQAVYLPIKDIDNVPVGMLSVAETQISIFQTAAKSLETTFIITAGIMTLSVLYSYLISRYLSRQLS
jgi:hypothetical protein